MNKGKLSMIDLLSNGRPFTKFTIIDCHAHLGGWYNFSIPECDEKSLIKFMNILGINRMCISALASVGPDFIYGNSWVYQVVKNYPLKFFGYIALNPNYPELIKPEIDKYWKNRSMHGIKIHPVFHDYPLGGKIYQRIFNIQQEKKGLILSHIWGINDVKTYGKIAQEFNDVTFLLAHIGGNERESIYEAINVTNKCKNIYIDLTGSFHFNGLVEFIVKEVGAEKVLFGTDSPFIDGRSAIGRVVYSDISEEDKAKILGLNMEKILLSV